MQVKVQQLQDTSTGLRTIEAYLVSSTFRELIRTGVHTDIQIS